MSVINSIGRGVAWNTAAAIAGKCLVLVNLFVILRFLSVYEYGLSELVMSVVSMLGILLLPGLGTAVIADISRERTLGKDGNPRSLLINFYILSAVLGVLAWAILFFGARYAAMLAGNSSIQVLIQIVSFLFLISPLRMVTTIVATVERRFVDQSFFGVTEELFKLLGILFFMVYLGKTVDGLLYAAVCAQLFAVAVYVPRTVSGFLKLEHEGVPHALLSIVRFHRKWSIAGTYVSSLTQTFQIWIVRLFLGTEAVALYSVAAGILSQVSTLLPLGTILGPIVPAYTHLKTHMRRLVLAALKVQTVLAVVLYGAAVASLPLFTYFFPSYKAAAWMVPVLLISLLPMSFLNITAPVFAALQEQRSFVESTALKLVLTALCFPVGMMLGGLMGLAIANTVVLTLSACERWLRLARISPDLRVGFIDLLRLTEEEQMLVRTLANKLYVRFKA